MYNISRKQQGLLSQTPTLKFPPELAGEAFLPPETRSKSYIKDIVLFGRACSTFG